jgi:ATP-dependent RNA helicase RhlE
MGALVLAPTRELAQQIAVMFNDLGHSSGIRVATVVGGIPIRHDWKALTCWPNVLVATPGRLIDHIESGSVVLRDIEVLVVDEADRMHDMGFIPQIRRILAALPTKRQTLMFSATMPADVEEIARRHMHDALRIQIGRRSAPAERAEQVLYKTNEHDKTPFLLKLLRQSEGRVLVFVRTKRGVDRLARAVMAHCQGVARLHADRSQPERDAAMGGFREGKYRVLIATDIAARGIDVADIEHVINYDFPQSAEDYVHRIGRTARVAASGRATSFVTRGDQRFVAEVERLVGAKLPLTPLQGTASQPSSTDADQPRRHEDRQRRSSHRGPRGGSRSHAEGATPGTQHAAAHGA